jgi:hypothetical protein
MRRGHRSARLVLLSAMLLLIGLPGFAFGQKGDISSVVTGKWKVIWYSDNGVEQNMEASKQQLILLQDGTGTMFMQGAKVGDVSWSPAGKNKINFSDAEGAPPYLVKVSQYKKGPNMLFTSTMPNEVVRKVYFERLASRE